MNKFIVDYRKSFLAARILFATLMIPILVYLIIVANPIKPIYAPPFFGRPVGELGVVAIRLLAFGLIGYLLLWGRNSLRLMRSSSPAIVCSEDGLFIDELMSTGPIPWSAISGFKEKDIDGRFVALKQPTIYIVTTIWHKYAKKRFLGMLAPSHYLLKGFTVPAREIFDTIESFREAARR